MNLSLFKPEHNFCFDTGAFINLRDRYPMSVFKSLWEELDKYVKSGYISSPEEVLNELSRYDDDIHGWVKQRKSHIIKDLDYTQVASVKQILKTHPLLLQEKKDKYDADAFVIAYAHAHDAIVVSEERYKRKDEPRPRIPDVCQDYKIEHLDLVGFLTRVGWKF